MKYAIIVKSGTAEQVAYLCRQLGATNVTVMPKLKQVYCETSSPEQLATIPGVVIKPVNKVSADVGIPRQRRTPSRQSVAGGTPLEVMYSQLPTYAASQASISSQMYDLRNVLDPPVVGSGTTIAILDTGIRKTHRGLLDKVIYEIDVSGSGTAEDIFSHGTAVAYMAAGGRHMVGEESGIAPGAMLMNIKVLNNEGNGDDETVAAGLEVVAELIAAADAQELPTYHPMYPNVINMSFGKPDTADEDDPMKLAIQAFVEEVGASIVIYAAAGNSGPEAGTITMPASMIEVIAVGAVTFSPFDIWRYSSRGPTKEGLIKPDFVFFGVDMVLASSKSDDAFEVKSGTSFAAPAMTGFWALGLEGLPRVMPDAMLEQYINLPPEQWQQIFTPLIAAMMIKPPGYVVGVSDNDWGYGFPLGSLAIAQMDQIAGGGDISSSLTGIMPAMLLMGMMPMLIGGMR